MNGKLRLTGGFDGRGCCFSLEIPVVTRNPDD
jgi:hypothetical protein